MKQPQQKRRVAVRALVESALMAGDLMPGASSRRLLDGIKGHLAIQSTSPEGVYNEVSLSTVVNSEHLELTVYGRADRVHGISAVEEIKTTTLPLSAISEPIYAHYAQAACYAYMLCLSQGLCDIDIQITYYRLPDGEQRTFTQTRTFDELSIFFSELTAAYLELLEQEYVHRLALVTEIDAAGFPFAEYREGQRVFAVQVYKAIRDSAELLAQAPTGTGKTMAAIFPAIKALSEGYIERVFYLTARTTTRTAALDAIARLTIPSLRTTVISAKEKACCHDKPRCSEGDCPRAAGYYDRLPAALESLFSLRRICSPDVIAAVAKDHRVCPFELSLDASLFADVIICDYNYAFDPRVRLQRFFGKGKQSQLLLIDEAHNLPDRARDMYSASLRLADIGAVRRAIPKEHRKRPIYKALTDVTKAIKALFSEADGERAVREYPCLLTKPLKLLVNLLEEEEARLDAAARDLWFSIAGFLYIAEHYDASYVTLLTGGNTTRVVTLYCCDAADNLKKVYKKCRAAVLFSATLTPAVFYRDLCGLSEKLTAIALPSPFPPENLLVLHRPLSTRYRSRESTLHSVVSAVLAFVRARESGNYMIFLPSYAYLSAFASLFGELFTEGRLTIQNRTMDDAARETFLQQFESKPCGLQVGIAVLGGAFAEGVDLPGERLCGAAIIGVGLPQTCLERDVLRAACDEKYENGYAYAYSYPGMGKVLQAAGRIIRTPKDRGALLLIDDRYSSSEYKTLLPQSWSIKHVVSDAELTQHCKKFWQKR